LAGGRAIKTPAPHLVTAAVRAFQSRDPEEKLF
jgi:hypothetical protein